MQKKFLKNYTIHLFKSVSMAALLCVPAAHAESYPNKPIKWTVGFPAGGGSDVLARTVAMEMGKRLNSQVIIENKAGAAGMIAAESILHAPADAYSLLTADVAILAFNPAIYPKIRYDAEKSFDAVGLMARFPILIATSPASGIKSMADLVAYMRTNSVGYGTAGVGTPHHLALEMLLASTKLKAEHIPYKGDAPALQDLAGGQIKLAALAPSLSLPFVKEGKLVALAVTSEKRLPQLPNVPTLKELSMSTDAVYAWQGLVVRKGTSPERVQKLSESMQASLKDPAVIGKLAELGMESVPSTAEEMRSYVQKEQERWWPMIKARGISSQ